MKRYLPEAEALIVSLEAQLAARDKTIERLKELVRFCHDEFTNGIFPDRVTWDPSETRRRLDSILGLSADPPATTPSPDLPPPDPRAGRPL